MIFYLYLYVLCSVKPDGCIAYFSKTLRVALRGGKSNLGTGMALSI